MTFISLFKPVAKITILRYLFWAGVLILTVISVTPKDFNEIIGFDIWDKSEHFFAYGILTILGRLAYPDKKHLAIIFLGLVALGSVLELIQHYIPNRQGGFGDVFANIAGITTGIVIEQFIGKLRTVRHNKVL